MPERKNKELQKSYELSKKIAKSHYENFPVGLFVKREVRKNVYAIYAFSRLADDIADSVKFDKATKLQMLNEYEALLLNNSTYNSKLLLNKYFKNNEHKFFFAVQDTLYNFQIPVQYLQSLLFAFKMDAINNTHNTFEDLLYYSSYSANPIGRIILHIFGITDDKAFEYSDNICTALQLTNFWQDTSIDIQNGRLYYPTEVLNKFGCSLNDLNKLIFNNNFKSMIKYLVDETMAMFLKGNKIFPLLKGRLKFEIILTYLGGISILKKITESDFNVFAKRPKLCFFDKLFILFKSIFLYLKY